MSKEDIFEIHEAFKLTDCGVLSSQSTWPRVSASNSSLTCVIHHDDKCESVESMHSSNSRQDSKATKVTIINANGKVISRSRTVAESAKIHPTKPIIALKAHNIFQVYNFETKNLLNELDVIHDISFWKWANEDTIILVTEASVYQWAVFTERNEAEFICQRLPRLNYTEIVNCAVDDHHRWYTVTGLLDRGKDSIIEGITQVYSAEYGVAQCIEAHAVTFVTHKFSGSIHESVIMCAASRQLESPKLNGKVHSIEFASAALSQTIPRLASSELKFPSHTGVSKVEGDNTNTYSTTSSHGMDFPVSIQADTSHCVLYIITKFGTLFIAELESAAILSQIQICSHITFCSSLDSLSTLTVINKASQVLKISIDWLLLIKQVATVLNRPDLAQRLQNSRGMENVNLLLDG